MSIWYLIGSAFLGGLILNLMPCVLPILSVKIMSFVHAAQGSKKAMIMHSLTYASGIIASYWTLALIIIIAGSLGGMLGWGFQFQTPWFGLTMAVIMAIMAANMFGVFEIKFLNKIPGVVEKWKAKFRKESQNGVAKKRGYVGSFFHGCLATLVGSACCGPFLGYAMGLGLTLPWYTALCVFTAIGTGMAFPYVLLSVIPGSKKIVPKPGKWMKYVKWVMGACMAVTSVWFLTLVF